MAQHRSGHGGKSGTGVETSRQMRLATALKANLRKRKTQVRNRADAPGELSRRRPDIAAIGRHED